MIDKHEQKAYTVPMKRGIHMFQDHVKQFIKERTITLPNTINAMMDMKLISATEQELILSFPVQAWQLNPMNTMHGGMLATIADMSMGCMSYALNGGFPNPTIEMQIRYLKGIKVDSQLIVKVHPLHVGSRMIQCSCELYINEEATPSATASASYMINDHKLEDEMII